MPTPEPEEDGMTEEDWENLWGAFQCSHTPPWTALDESSKEGFRQAWYFRVMPYMRTVVHAVEVYDTRQKAARN